MKAQRYTLNERPQALFKTYPVLLTMADGSRLNVEITTKNKPYFVGEFERKIVEAWNKRFRTNVKCIRAKIFRNSHEGGVQIVGDRVLEVY